MVLLKLIATEDLHLCVCACVNERIFVCTDE